MDNEEPNLLVTQADSAYTNGRLSDALLLYREALQANPELAWAHSRVGAILAQLGDDQAAETALSRAIELDPALPQAHSNLGNLYYAHGEYEKAVSKYKDAVALSPTTALYHENLHAAYKKMGKLAEAVSALKQAHRLNRESVKTEAKERFRSAQQGVKGRVGCLTVILLPILVAVGALML